MDGSAVDTLGLLPLILLGLGLLFSAIGVVLVVRLRRFRRTAVRVPGVVADVVYDGSAGDSGSGGLWFPVLSFTTGGGSSCAHAGALRPQPGPGESRGPGDRSVRP